MQIAQSKIATGSLATNETLFPALLTQPTTLFASDEDAEETVTEEEDEVAEPTTILDSDGDAEEAETEDAEEVNAEDEDMETDEDDEEASEEAADEHAE
jgi:hypothetical protein